MKYMDINRDWTLQKYDPSSIPGAPPKAGQSMCSTTICLSPM